MEKIVIWGENITEVFKETTKDRRITFEYSLNR